MIRKLKIYLAGGMGSLTWEEQNLWREIVKHKLDHWELDIINPCDYYNFKEKKHKSEGEIVKFDLNHVRTSDLIIVNFNDKNSIGTAIEIGIANELRIPILGVSEIEQELHPWLKYMCDRIFNNINEVVEYVEEFYLN